MNSPNRISALIAHLALSCALSFGCVDPQEATISGYPEAPAYATATVHVNPFGEAAVPNGTVDKPFPTVRAAIESFATPPGAAIVIAPGEYKEAADATLTIDRCLYLIGPGLKDGEPQVTLDMGEAAVGLRIDFDPFSEDEGCSDAEVHASLERIRITGGGAANTVVSGPKNPASLSNAESETYTGPVVHIQDAVFEGLEDWEPPVDDQEAAGPWGLVVKRGAYAELAAVTVKRAMRSGIMVQDAGMVLSGGSRVIDNEGEGIRLEMADVTIHDAEINDNNLGGVGVYSSNLLLLDSSLVNNNDDDDADAVAVTSLDESKLCPSGDCPSSIVAHRNLADASGRYGIFVDGAHTFELVGNWINGLERGNGAIRVEMDTSGDEGPPRGASADAASDIFQDADIIYGNEINAVGTGIRVIGAHKTRIHCNTVNVEQGSLPGSPDAAGDAPEEGPEPGIAPDEDNENLSGDAISVEEGALVQLVSNGLITNADGRTEIFASKIEKGSCVSDNLKTTESPCSSAGGPQPGDGALPMIDVLIDGEATDLPICDGTFMKLPLRCFESCAEETLCQPDGECLEVLTEEPEPSFVETSPDACDPETEDCPRPLARPGCDPETEDCDDASRPEDCPDGEEPCEWASQESPGGDGDGGEEKCCPARRGEAPECEDGERPPCKDNTADPSWPDPEGYATCQGEDCPQTDDQDDACSDTKESELDDL